MPIVLSFKKIGFNSEILFSLKAQLTVEISSLSPDPRDLAQMLPPRRVVSKSPSRSRSPSPQAHKKLAKTVTQPPQLYFEVFNDVESQFLLSQRLWNVEETMVVTEKHENIKKHDMWLESVQDEENTMASNQVRLRVRLTCESSSESGHIWISISSQNYYIKALPDTRFAVISS